MSRLRHLFRHEIELWEDIRGFFSAAFGKDKRPPAIPYSHPRYGRFEDAGEFYYSLHTSVEVTWLGKAVAFSPDATPGTRERGSEIIEASFDTMDALMEDQAGWHDKARAAILAETYPFWRNEWRDPETGPELTEDEFWSRITLANITTGEDGWFNLTFAVEGELLSDHAICVTGSIAAGVEDVAIEG